MALYAPSPYGDLYDQIEGSPADNATASAPPVASPYEGQHQQVEAVRPEHPGLFSIYANNRADALMTDGTTYDSGTSPEAPPAPPPPEHQGVLLPPNASAADTIKAMTLNRAGGVGNGVGLTPPPKPPTPKEVSVRADEETGKQVLFDQNKIPKPMESNAFNMGLMSFGLNLLSGNDWATSFNQAGSHFEKAYGREKREHWAQDLRAQGYDDQDIMQWIETGDKKSLTDPMQKKMQMQQYKMGQEQLTSAMRANDPATLAYQQERQAWNDNMQMQQMQNQTMFQNENLKIAQAQLGMQQQKMELAARVAQQKAGEEAPFGLDKNFYRTQTQNAMPFLRDTQVKMARGNLALQSMEKLMKNKDNLSTDEKWSLYNTAQEALGKAYQGGYGALSPKVRDEYVGDPSTVGSASEKAYKWATGGVTNAEIDRVYKLAKGFMESEHASTADVANNMFNSIAPRIGPERALQMLQGMFASTNMGDPAQYIRGQYANQENVTIQR